MEFAPAVVIDLNGTWRFELAGHARDITVPGAWEASQDDWLTDGPARYSRTFQLPAPPAGSCVLFEADAISFAAEVFVNGKNAGAHCGLWTSFQLDITDLARPGKNRIEIVVWKPGARHPVRECAAGFLPDVAGAFGGIWQPCRIRMTPAGAWPDPRAPATDRSRAITVRGAGLWRGDQPLHLRGVLDWGWDPARFCPTPTAPSAGAIRSRARARAST